MMRQTFFRAPARAIGMLEGVRSDGSKYETKLTAADWSVLAVICLHADRNGRAFPSQSRIGELAGIARRHVPRTIKRLIEVGLLAAGRVRNDNGAWENTVYQITFKPSGVSLQAGTGVPSGGALTEPTLTTQEEGALNVEVGDCIKTGGVPSYVTTPSAWGLSGTDTAADFVYDDDFADDTVLGQDNGPATSAATKGYREDYGSPAGGAQLKQAAGWQRPRPKFGDNPKAEQTRRASIRRTDDYAQPEALDDVPVVS